MERELSNTELDGVAGGETNSCWRWGYNYGWSNICYTASPQRRTHGATTSQPTSEPTLQHEAPHAS
jgi:hypothetical protein